jgi:G:T-mismatch repair DNA endonuclease (very short patch repair protein)
LRKSGWKVIRIWECQLTRKKQARVMRRLRAVLSESRH